MARLGRVGTGLGLGLAVGLAGVALAHWPLAENLELRGLDLLFQLRGPRPAPRGLVVVGIDNVSYEELHLSQQRAIPRGVHAALIRTLKSRGARAIAFDIVFEDPGDPQQDAAFEDSLKAAGNVVLGEDLEITVDPRFRQVTPHPPYAPFAQAAARVGDVTLPLDEVIRRTWLVHENQPSLALAAWQVATGRESPDGSSDRLIDYYGPERTIPTVSLYQAIAADEHLPPRFFQDAVVFVGLSQPAAAGPAAKDAFSTPFRGRKDTRTYGVEIHATIAGNLLENRQVQLLSAPAEAAFLLLLPVLASVAFLMLGPLRGALALAGLEAGLWIGASCAFSFSQLWLPVMIASLVQLPAAYVLALLWYYLTTVRERERIRRAFSFYLSSEMIAKVTADPSSLSLGGEEIVATALFTDIAGFTSIAESLAPPETAALLNAYFSEVTRHIFEEEGTLIKFIGDAVFAIWGAPLRRADHASAACRAALALARSQDAASAGDEGAPVLITRIGVHSGPMLVGNLGSAQRFDYTAIGDAVNVASRLEGLNKILGTRALVSGSALSGTGNRFVARRLGCVRVVGKNEPVEIHELLGTAGEPTRPDAGTIAVFSAALASFEAGKFEDAAAGFREARSRSGGTDGPCGFYLATIDRFASDPPGPEWDGSITFTAK